MPFGLSRHNHGPGYNFTLLDGSAQFVVDRDNFIENQWVSTYWGINTYAGYHYIMTNFFRWSESQYQTACP